MPGTRAYVFLEMNMTDMSAPLQAFANVANGQTLITSPITSVMDITARSESTIENIVPMYHMRQKSWLAMAQQSKPS